MSTKIKYEDAQKQLKRQKEKDKEMVTGIFRFFECPGGSVEFIYSKYNEEPTLYRMVDGNQYTIPYGVAKHLNQNTWYPVHHYNVDETGKPTERIGKKVYRCAFQSMDFMDNQAPFQAESSLVTVEKV